MISPFVIYLQAGTLVGLILLQTGVLVSGPLTRFLRKRQLGERVLQLPVASSAKDRVGRPLYAVIAAVVLPIVVELSLSFLKAILWNGVENSPLALGFRALTILVCLACYAGTEKSLFESRRDKMRWLGIAAPLLSIAMGGFGLFCLIKFTPLRAANTTILVGFIALCILFISFNLLRIRRAFGPTVVYENGVDLGSQTLLWCEVKSGYVRKRNVDGDLVLKIPAPWPIGAIPVDESVWDCTIPVSAGDKETITKLLADGEVLPPKNLAQLS